MKKAILYTITPENWARKSEERLRAQLGMDITHEEWVKSIEPNNPASMLAFVLKGEQPMFDSIEEAAKARKKDKLDQSFDRIRITIENIDEEGKEIE